MLRKLTLLLLAGGAAAWFLRNRDDEPIPAYSPPPPGSERADDIAEVRSDQPSQAGTGDAVIPDVSDEDPLVRQQESAARAAAGSIGGEADTVTAEVEPEMRPVVEGSGDAEETFEQIEDEGR